MDSTRSVATRTVRVEPAREEDAPAIAEIQVAGVEATVGSLLPRKIFESPETKPGGRLWRRWIARARTRTFVARDGDQVVGFASLEPARDEISGPESTAESASAAPREIAELAAVYVAPSHWQRGLGRRLAERTIAEAEHLGFPEIALWVLEDNRRARSFYQALGFVDTGVSRIFAERGQGPLRELRYRRPIADRAPAVRPRYGFEPR